MDAHSVLIGQSLIDFMSSNNLDITNPECVTKSLDMLASLGYKDCSSCLCIFPYDELDKDYLCKKCQ